ncbi:FtsH protease activity modulator HflK [Pallidibacillus pasinlerensis]|uniref:Protein HflK n=1 Tax=Pallidibacillus pasinlerensis TaxID=2703818 RepID=A0ABX0A5W3_9BACI|nr:FtsH protease activity modulator HflK [Pallidibacillus pasinlerensis]NCU18853.1 FtsH protease activity modulator HflK [Pallidibacillus pasinlerensis]
MASLRQIYVTTGIVIGIIILGLIALTSWYTVDESDQAVILTFGKAEETITEPGLKFKLPWPIQSVEKVSKETYSLQFGFGENSNEEDAKMITGDENIVYADLVVQYKIADPIKYLFNAENPREILYDATSASLRSIIGSSQIDDALTDGKAEIEAEVWDLLTRLVDSYDIGVSIQAVKLQDVELPNDEVQKAFTKVTDARETMQTKLNEAEKYKNQMINEAEGEVEAIISRAAGEKAARIEEARGNVAVFNSLLTEYQKSPEVTRDRLVIETLERVLPNAQIYIMNDDSGTLTYLPLNPVQQAQPPVNTSEEENKEGENNE